jgi:hypothetical protein
MNEAREKIREALTGAKRPCVMSSFGKDSVLLLSLIREITDEFDVFWFRPEGKNDFALSLILEWDLTVYSYLPSDRFFIPSGAGIALVSDYSINGHPFPVLTDIAPGEACSLKLSKERTPYFTFPWDAVFWGLKRCDTHPALEGIKLEGDFDFAGARFVAPLWEMTDEEVWDAISTLGVPFDERRYEHGGTDPDVLSACTKCFTSQSKTVFCPDIQRSIPTMSWGRQQSLAAFRARFGAA